METPPPPNNNTPKHHYLNLIKHPYLSRSSHLFDSFYFFSYDSTYIEHHLTINLPSNIKSKHHHNSTTPLHGINHSLFKKQLCISSSYSKLKCPDNIIRECVLNGDTPDIFIYLDTSSNFDSSNSFNNATTSLSYINSSDENDNINTICVLSKRFYDIHQTINNVNIIVPKYLCFISEYPYWSMFDSILNHIWQMFIKGAKYFPIECAVFNLLEFSPSPIWSSVQLNYEKLLRNQNAFDNDDDDAYNKNDYVYTLTQISAYPVIDVNISEIFKVIPLRTFIKVFVLSFIEIDILFFSKKAPEVLGPIMFVIANLAYPCMQSMYLWNIVTVSEEELVKGRSLFVNKPFSKMCGVKGNYDKKGKYLNNVPYYVVDIDKQVFMFVDGGNSCSNNDIASQYGMVCKCVDRLLQDKKMKESVYFAEELQLLCKEMELLLQSNNNNDNNVNNANMCNCSTNNNNNIELYSINDDTKAMNIAIQQHFYNFVLDVLKRIYTSYKVKLNYENTNDNDECAVYMKHKLNVNALTVYDKAFIELFKLTGKYRTFFELYIKKQDVHEMFIIPYAFAEEFIALKLKSQHHITSSTYFEVMNDLYYNNTNENCIVFNDDYDILYTAYNASMRNEIENVIQLSNISITITNNETQDKHYKYPSINFNTDVFEKYISLLISLKSVVDSISIKQLIQLNKKFKLQLYDVSNVIETYIYKHKLCDNNELIALSTLMFVVIITNKAQPCECNVDVVCRHIGIGVKKYISTILEAMCCCLINDEQKANEYEDEMLSYFIAVCKLMKKNVVTLNKNLKEVITLLMQVYKKQNIKMKLNTFCKKSIESNNDNKCNNEHSNKTMYTYELMIYYLERELRKDKDQKTINRLISYCSHSNSGEFIGTNAETGKYMYSLQINIYKDGNNKQSFKTEVMPPSKIYLYMCNIFNEFVKNKFAFPSDTNKVKKIMVNLIFYINYVCNKELKQIDFTNYLEMFYNMI